MYKSVAEAIVKFSLEMNHLQEVVFVMDSEPATVGLLDMAITIQTTDGIQGGQRSLVNHTTKGERRVLRGTPRA